MDLRRPAPDARALALTPEYDQGQTPFDLDEMGKNLTARGLPVRPGGKGVRGLIVTRAYRLSDRRAHVAATPIETV